MFAAMMVCASSALLGAAQDGRPPVAVFAEPTFPTEWAATEPARVRSLLESRGVQCVLIDAAALGDPAALTPARYSAVVLPYGPRFPLPAVEPFRSYLRSGGRFLSLGGYAFRGLVERTGNGWGSYEERIARERSRDALVAGNTLVAPGAIQWIGASAQTVVRPLDGGGVRIETSGEGGGVAAVLTLDPAKSYALHVRSRADGVAAPGFCYVAVYEYDAENKIVQWFDANQLRGTTDWREVTRVFKPPAKAARRELHLGTYRGAGAAEFSEILVSPWPDKLVMTTADGNPQDGLVCAPEQIGAFDADFPLRRATRLASGDAPWLRDVSVAAPRGLQGWAATGVTGGASARWMPVLRTEDQYGRPTGPAAALLCHYGGYYAGSMWAYCGVEGDVTHVLGDKQAGAFLAGCVEFLSRGVFLQPVRCDYDSYAPGETPRVTVRVNNTSDVAREVEVTIRSGDRTTQARATVGPRGVAEVPLALAPAAGDGFVPLRVEVAAAGEPPFDSVRTGYVVVPPGSWPKTPRVAFRDNTFTIDGRPRVLLGSDTYANVFSSPSEGPAGWARDLSLCRDFGLDVYENLQFGGTGERWPEGQFRQLDGILRMAHELDRIYMAGWFVGGDTWIPDAKRGAEKDLMRELASRYREAPALIHYVNGDLSVRSDPSNDLPARFRAWLVQRYGSEDAVLAAWGRDRYKSIDQVSYPLEGESAWASPAARDAAWFGIELTRTWLSGLAGTIRESGGGQPITSEYYQIPMASVDLPETADTMDVANIGFFGHEKGRDLRDLGPALAFADSRARGRGINIGEYGVKTHPAWSVANGASDYHVARTEAEQRALFVGLIHMGLGMGVSKFQNWCLRDADEQVFPWGLFYPNDQTPKPCAYTLRSLSLLTRAVVPKYRAPEVTVLLPDYHRLGGGGSRAYEACLRAFETLLDLQIPFNTLPDTHLADLPAETRVVWWPVPFTCSEDSRARIESFVRGGGRLFLSGDLSWDEERHQTRLDRFQALVGAHVTEPGGDPDALATRAAAETSLGRHVPVHRMTADDARVAAAYADDDPLLLVHKLAGGTVAYLNSAAELRLSSGDLLPAYRAAGEALGVRGLGVGGPGLYSFRFPTYPDGEALCVVNMRKEPAEVGTSVLGPRVRASLAREGVLLVAVDQAARWRAVSVAGKVTVGDAVELDAPGGAVAIRLGATDLAVAVGPYGPGAVRLRAEGLAGARWEFGECRGGHWTTFEQHERLADDELRIEDDPGNATLFALAAQPAAQDAARRLVVSDAPCEAEGR